MLNDGPCSATAGHGSNYAFDASTWTYFCKHKPGETALFKVLRAFHAGSAKLQAAVDHLVDIGFLRRLDVWRVGEQTDYGGCCCRLVCCSLPTMPPPQCRTALGWHTAYLWLPCCYTCWSPTSVTSMHVLACSMGQGIMAIVALMHSFANFAACGLDLSSLAHNLFKPVQEVNSSIAQHGGRLQLGQLDPEGVDK
eukprot:GHRR01029374.1.p1 GENE.GHRR01029374.1~~GHRR01029374.1.p1  ORF type:complete len:213 (+),score=47.05 GHRR01029374.1:56-640(+)